MGGRCARSSPHWAPGRSSSSRTAPGRTARSNASTAPWPPNGPTGRHSPATPSPPPPLPPGSSTTTLDAATAHSAGILRSAGWHQPDGRVQLEDLLLALGEATGNAVEHAYRDPDVPGRVGVQLHLDNVGDVVVSVTDTGTWRPPSADPGF